MSNAFEEYSIASLVQFNAMNAAKNVKIPISLLPENIPGSLCMTPGIAGQPEIRRTDGTVWTSSGTGTVTNIATGTGLTGYARAKLTGRPRDKFYSSSKKLNITFRASGFGVADPSPRVS